MGALASSRSSSIIGCTWTMSVQTRVTLKRPRPHESIADANVDLTKIGDDEDWSDGTDDTVLPPRANDEPKHSNERFEHLLEAFKGVYEHFSNGSRTFARSLLAYRADLAKRIWETVVSSECAVRNVLLPWSEGCSKGDTMVQTFDGALDTVDKLQLEVGDAMRRSHLWNRPDPTSSFLATHHFLRDQGKAVLDQYRSVRRAYSDLAGFYEDQGFLGDSAPSTGTVLRLVEKRVKNSKQEAEDGVDEAKSSQRTIRSARSKFRQVKETRPLSLLESSIEDQNRFWRSVKRHDSFIRWSLLDLRYRLNEGPSVLQSIRAAEPTPRSQIFLYSVGLANKYAEHLSCLSDQDGAEGKGVFDKSKWEAFGRELGTFSGFLNQGTYWISGTVDSDPFWVESAREALNRLVRWYGRSKTHLDSWSAWEEEKLSSAA